MTHRGTFAYYGKYRLVKHHIHCTWAHNMWVHHLFAEGAVHSTTGDANIQGRIDLRSDTVAPGTQS